MANVAGAALPGSQVAIETPGITVEGGGAYDPGGGAGDPTVMPMSGTIAQDQAWENQYFVFGLALLGFGVWWYLRRKK